MECTQRLECTQEPYDTFSERTCPEQIGFLGICGAKHPVKKGPNKIGRDPQTCSIILNDNSISRQHAVINILNKKDFMLMDLDSSNKTKLLDKTLQPYIPYPLGNGDTVQFGQLFGIFRLFEEDNALPMTQAVEIPETPICIRNVSRLKPAPITTVPESPDVSDRDDSVIAQSPKNKSNYKSPNNSFIKSRKIIEAQEIGTNKINNVYWTSSKKSDSFSSHFESNESFKSPKKLTLESSIYDMETQVPGLPAVDETSHSIYEAETQVPKKPVSPSIYNCETQVPNVEKLPEVFKVRDQNNVQLNLYSTNEKFNIFEAQTQVTFQGKDKGVVPTLTRVTDKQNNDDFSSIQNKLNSSDEEICFDEIDCLQNEDECGSQPLLPPDLDGLVTHIVNKEKQGDKNIEKNESKTNAVLNDSDTKDSEEIAPSQQVIEKPIDDEDVTDCEDNNLEFALSVAKESNKIDDEETDCEDVIKIDNVNSIKKTQGCDDDLTDCEDDFIEISQNRSKVSNLPQDFDDLPTQIIREESVDKEKISESGKDDVPFEEMLTQVIDDGPVEIDAINHEENHTNKSIPFEDLQTQVIDIEIPQEQSSSTTNQNKDIDNFKRPVSSPKLRKKDVTPLMSSKSLKLITKVNLQSKIDDEQNYYDATQDILVDLCTQSEQINTTPSTKIETHDLSRERNNLITERSSGATEKIDGFIANMSKEQIRKVIGADVFVSPLSKKKSSDSSDLEVTPQKFNVSKFLMIDLPDSQDINACDFITSKKDEKDSSDGLEDEENNEDNSQSGTRRRRRKKDIKLDLMKKFDVNTLPSRAITRIRKPTSKILDSDRSTKNLSERILQSNLGLDKDHEIDGEIIELNLRRLRNKMEKVKNKSSSSDRKSDKDEKEQSLQSIDKKESKEHIILPLKTEKNLQQQTIKNMFKEPSSKSPEGAGAHKNVKTESINFSKESRRSSRNKSKEDKKDVTKTKVKIESSEKKKSSSRSHSSRKQEKETIDLTNEEQMVVRRSRRHQSCKDKLEDKKEKLQRNKRSDKSGKLHSVVSENNELSAVYNLSSEAGVDSPANLKRQASGDISTSKTKRIKSSDNNASIRTSSLRGVKTQYVLFTAFPCDEVKHKLEKLGAVVVSDVKECTVVLTLQLRRTFKMLCAIGLGKPIVGPNWVQACVDSNMIVDPWLYLLKDEASEKRFAFNLRQTLTGRRNYLKGHNVSCTPNVSPCEQEMKCIVECSGGTWKQGGRRWFCVTSPADKEMWPELQRRGATLVKAEFVLGGVLQQRINLERDKLG